MTFPILGGNGAVAGYSIDNSLRFNDDDSASLSRTPSSAGNRKTWTLSGWFKKSAIDTSQDHFFQVNGSSDSTFLQLRWDTNDLVFSFYNYISLRTDAKFRDCSSWYHIVVAVDTTQATASNRIKLYVNGTQITSFSTEVYPSQNDDTGANGTYAHYIGSEGGSGAFFDGYMAEYHLIDGQQLSPTDFGEFDEDSGIWKPIEYTGTYGNNGFYLDFSDRNTQHTLTVNGDTEHSTTQNKIGSTSIKFDGTGDYLTATSSDFAFQLQDFTAEAWIYPTSLYNYIAIFSTRANNLGYPDAFHLGIDANGRITSYSDRNIAQSATGAITTNSWQHVALVRQDMTHRIYVDGTQVASGSDTDSTTRTLLGIGAIPSGQEAFTGFLDEIRISDNARYPDGTSFTPYTSALTEDENTVLLIHSDTTNGSTTFTDSSGSAGGVVGLGADQSGNGNNFTTTNLVQTDQTTDTPTNNFATLNPLSDLNCSFSEGNVEVIRASDAATSCVSTIAPTSGKWYYEFQLSAGNNVAIGVAGLDDWQSGTDLNNYANKAAVMLIEASYNASIGYVASSSSATTLQNSTNLNTAKYGMAVDLDNGNMYASANGSWYSSVSGAFDKANFSDATAIVTDIPTGEPMAMAFRIAQSSAYINFGNAGGDDTISSGNTDDNGYGNFEYAPPSGYLALCTQNLATALSPTIDDGSEYFHTQLYTGNGSADRDITNDANAGDFQPDWLWIKTRSLSGNNHHLFNSNVGMPNHLSSDLTDVEQTATNKATAFNTDGFRVQTHSSVNQSSATYVAWQWKANGGTTSSNTDGDVTSTVQVNQTAGFSITTFTGNSSPPLAVGHGLGVAPQVVLAKHRNVATHWRMWHQGLSGAGYYLILDSTNAQANSEPIFSGLPTSTTVGFLSDFANTSHDVVFYSFAEIEGYSKFGSYTGNGSTDGTFVYTGFRPAFVLCKNIDATFNWMLFDNKRGAINVIDELLEANTSDAERHRDDVDFLSNGFKYRDTSGEINGSYTFIYMAFAENPFVSSSGVPVVAR